VINSNCMGRTWCRPRHLRATFLSLLALGISSTPAWMTPRAQAAVGRANVTITLAGPNQWNNSGTSFGQPWEQAVATFEKLNPGVTFKTNVLPLTSFFQTEATLLQAGSAPELIFNQTNYKPFQVVALNKYLMQPNPYAPGRKRWIDWFDPRGFSAKQQDTNGKWDWVPFNFVDAGLFINESAFAKAGVKWPIATWEDWRTAVKKLKAAGYTPLAMDGSYLGIDWTFSTVANMLLAKYFNSWNKYQPNGTPGTNDQLVIEDYVRALKTGVNIAQLPEMAEALTLTKEVYATAATSNWSGIKGLSGAGVDLPDFTSGKAAMAWAVNFGVSELEAAKPSFKVGSIGWPTITKATTPLSTGEPARFGVTAGGTSYMIPSSTKGDKLTYAVKFLQYMTAPKYNQPWISATNGAASIQTVKSPANIAGFSAGQWGVLPRANVGLLTNLSPQNNTQFQQIMQGYLLGSTSLSATESALLSSWQQAANYQITQNPKWKSESWAK
jgi:ABC-type glycerol-3-phosphate transport system substrate-binding protein